MRVEVFVDPSCPWAYITSLWLREVAPHRDLELVWRSFCLEIRDDYGVAPTMPEERRDAAIAAHALSHRMLRIMEAAKAARRRRCRRAAAHGVGAAVLSARLRARRLDPRRVPRRVRARCRPARGGRRREVGRADHRGDRARLRVRRAQDADADDPRARRPAPRIQGAGDGARTDRRRPRCASGTRFSCSRASRASSRSRVRGSTARARPSNCVPPGGGPTPARRGRRRRALRDGRARSGSRWRR